MQLHVVEANKNKLREYQWITAIDWNTIEQHTIDTNESEQHMTTLRKYSFIAIHEAITVPLLIDIVNNALFIAMYSLTSFSLSFINRSYHDI